MFERLDKTSMEVVTGWKLYLPIKLADSFCGKTYGHHLLSLMWFLFSQQTRDAPSLKERERMKREGRRRKEPSTFLIFSFIRRIMKVFKLFLTYIFLSFFFPSLFLCNQIHEIFIILLFILTFHPLPSPCKQTGLISNVKWFLCWKQKQTLLLSILFYRWNLPKDSCEKKLRTTQEQTPPARWRSPELESFELFTSTLLAILLPLTSTCRLSWLSSYLLIRNSEREHAEARLSR